MKKIMVLYSTGGMGHKKAALAVTQALDKKYSGKIEILDIDALSYASRLYKFLYTDFYVFCMTRARLFWGMMYYFSDIPWVNRITKKFRKAMDHRNFKGLEDLLIREKPDAIVATHFVLPAIADAIKARGGFSPGLFVVITDYGPHAFWLSDHIDKFFVGSAAMADEMTKRGIPEGKLAVTGIPATEEFSGSFDMNDIRKKHGLEDGKKTLLILSGGFGVGPTAAILRSLRTCRTDIQAIVVCGHNKKAYSDINVLKGELSYPIKLMGFTDKVAELMALSDIMITKAGGISVTEALDMRLPMILLGSIPGQETWNEKFLVVSGAARKVRSVGKLPAAVDEMFTRDDIYKVMKRSIDAIRRPRAAEDIADILLEKMG